MSMSRTVYVNGAFLPEAEATVSVFDRGFLMADGVYEVTSVLNGRLVDFAGHMARLRRSLAELAMASPMDDDALLALHREVVALNGLEDGMVYLQVTRGAPPERDFAYPDPATPPTVVMFTQAKPGPAWRVTRVRPRTIQALLEVPSVTTPSSTIQASSAPRALASILAMLGYSSCTVLMSRRAQR